MDGEVTFSPYNTSIMCRSIVLVDDDIAENPETFTVTLNAIEPDMVSQPNTATVTIIDETGTVTDVHI